METFKVCEFSRKHCVRKTFFGRHQSFLTRLRRYTNRNFVPMIFHRQRTSGSIQSMDIELRCNKQHKSAYTLAKWIFWKNEFWSGLVEEYYRTTKTHKQDVVVVWDMDQGGGGMGTTSYLHHRYARFTHKPHSTQKSTFPTQRHIDIIQLAMVQIFKKQLLHTVGR
jgi:hypothetical protein